MVGPHFQDAAKDYDYLVQKGYPSRGFLQLVGDRYRLNSTERTMLYRGILPEISTSGRKKRLVALSALSHQQVYIDGFNVALTITSYLQGLQVFLSTDRLLRDASSLRGKIIFSDNLANALSMITEFLHQTAVSYASFFFDGKVEIYEQVAQHLSKTNHWDSRCFEIRISDAVDKELMAVEKGIVCTSDTGIIDGCKCPIFDLPKHLLQTCFQPDFFDLREVTGRK